MEAEPQSGDFSEEGLALGAPALLLAEPLRLLAVLPIQDEGPVARAGPT
jgi:hypothetical protein